MKDKIKVCIFDDHRALLNSLEAIIASQDDMLCTGAYLDCSTLDEKLRDSNPDVVLMDIQMPGMNGIEATEHIHKNYPEVRILIQTVFEDEEKIFRSITNGASGYILKNESPEAYIESIKYICRGGIPMTPIIAQKILSYFRLQNDRTHSKEQLIILTSREIEVLHLLVKGKSHKMIAGDLFISIHTVDSHIRNIYEKLKVNSVAEAVNKAHINKLI